jgi:hypothetical protein
VVDRYTKAVLTVIAACLVVLVFRASGAPVPPALAQGAPVHVYVEGVALQFVGP